MQQWEEIAFKMINIALENSFFSYIWQTIVIGIITFVLLKLITGLIRFRRYRECFTSVPGYPDSEIHWIYGHVHKDKIENCVKLGKSFEVFEYMGLCTLDILLRCAFSYTDDVQGLGEKHPYIKAINELVAVWAKRTINPLLYSNFIFYLTPDGRQFSKNCKYVHKFAENIITRRRQELEKAGPGLETDRKYSDFLDILLKARDENNKGLSELEIRNEADTFLFEGHDTTTSALSWTIHSIITHPECQKKVQEEMDEIFKGRGSATVSLEDLHKMEYLTMCIKESLRMCCPVFYIQRKTTKDLELDGHNIPSGTIVGVHVYEVHHNPTVWENPTEFLPERFTTENAKNRDPFAFIPFSAGPRGCIGQNFAMHEIKVLLARIFHKYTLELDMSIPVKRKLSITLRAENGIHVFAKPRTA